MVVRFITRRFIGEYDPNLEKIYTYSTVIDNEIVLFEILDAAGKLNVRINPFSLNNKKTLRLLNNVLSFFFTFHFIGVGERESEL